jgi:hypothetical protein
VSALNAQPQPQPVTSELLSTELLSADLLSAESLQTESNGITSKVEAASAAEITPQVRISGDEKMGPQLVTGVMTWLNTDSKGNTFRITSTYINDRDDIDYEPSTTQQAVEVTEAPDMQSETSIGTIPVMSFRPSPTFEEIPAVSPTRHTNTVMITQSPTSAIHSASPVQTAPWDGYGVPWILLSMLRGKRIQKAKDVANVNPAGQNGQKGRVEDDVGKGNVIEDAYDRQQLFDLYKELVKDYGPSLMFPNIAEQEMMFPLANGEIATGTLQTSAGTSFVVGSATVGIGGPAATYHGEVVSLASDSLVVGGKVIPIQAVAPVNPTDYAAAVTIDDGPVFTLIKPADNPGIMTVGSNTLTAGGAPMVTAGHSIFYNDFGAVVVDGTNSIDPTPIRNVAGGAATKNPSNGDNGSSAQGSNNSGSSGQGSAGSAGGNHKPVTMGGIVMDGGAAIKNNAPATSMAMETGSPSEASGFKTITTDGAVKTVKAAQASKSSAAPTKVASMGSSIASIDVRGVAIAAAVTLGSFLIGVFSL